MKLQFNRQVFENNKQTLKEYSKKKNLNLAFMLKKEMIQMEKYFDDNDFVYTTFDESRFDNINSRKNNIIIDAFQYRQGIELSEAHLYTDKKAIVNFYCSQKKIPLDIDLHNIYTTLKEIGFKTVSFGGSLMFYYDYSNYEQIRCGELLFTGYSTVFNRGFADLKNPFCFQKQIFKRKGNKIIIKTGFLDFQGITNDDLQVVSVCTDFTTLIDKTGQYNKKYVKLYPDYFTLMKMFYKGVTLND